MLTKQCKEEIAKETTDAVWNRIKSADIKYYVRVGRMAESIDDVNFIVKTFLKYAANAWIIK